MDSLDSRSWRELAPVPILSRVLAMRAIVQMTRERWAQARALGRVPVRLSWNTRPPHN